MASVTRNLPLVIPNQSQLGQLAHIFLQGKNLANSPLLSESLARRYFAELTRHQAGNCFLPVDFSGGGEVAVVPWFLVI